MTQPDSWRVWFFVFAALVVAWQALRGWQLGIARVLLNIFALATAYAIAFWCRGIAAPWLRPLGYPDFVNSAVGGSLVMMQCMPLVGPPASSRSNSPTNRPPSS